jgi:hypothetical protein
VVISPVLATMWVIRRTTGRPESCTGSVRFAALPRRAGARDAECQATGSASIAAAAPWANLFGRLLGANDGARASRPNLNQPVVVWTTLGLSRVRVLPRPYSGLTLALRDLTL